MESKPRHIGFLDAYERARNLPMKEGGKNMEESAAALRKWGELHEQYDRYLDEAFGRENMFTLVVSENTLPSILHGNTLHILKEEARQEYHRLLAEGL